MGVVKERLTIQRSKWLRGEGPSSLFDSKKEKMCCLGFYALQCGLTEKDIRDVHTPADTPNAEVFPDWLVSDGSGTDDGDTLMEINDSQKTTEKDREKRLKALFKQNGVIARFVK